VAQCHASDLLGFDVGVRDLERHADREGEVNLLPARTQGGTLTVIQSPGQSSGHADGRGRSQGTHPLATSFSAKPRCFSYGT